MLETVDLNSVTFAPLLYSTTRVHISVKCVDFLFGLEVSWQGHIEALMDGGLVYKASYSI